MAGKDEPLKHYTSNPLLLRTHGLAVYVPYIGKHMKTFVETRNSETYLLLGTHGQAASAGKTNPL